MVQTFRVLLFLSFCQRAFAQETPIVFDRPGIADSPYLVAQKTWQFETGIGYSALTGWRDVPNPSLMLRKAISKNDELRLTYNYGLQTIALTKDDLTMGFNHFALGWKRKLAREHKWVPESSFIVNMYFPFKLMNNIFHSGVYNFEAGFQFQNNLNSRFSLNYNVGTLLTNKYTRGTLTSSLCMNFNATEKLGFFVEGFLYAPFSQYVFEPGADAGFVFNPTKRTQLDFSIIENYYNRSHYLTLLIGYSISIGCR
jgi:hypothetical protein